MLVPKGSVPCEPVWSSLDLNVILNVCKKKLACEMSKEKHPSAGSSVCCHSPREAVGASAVPSGEVLGFAPYLWKSALPGSCQPAPFSCRLPSHRRAMAKAGCVLCHCSLCTVRLMFIEETHIWLCAVLELQTKAWSGKHLPILERETQASGQTDLDYRKQPLQPTPVCPCWVSEVIDGT